MARVVRIQIYYTFAILMVRDDFTRWHNSLPLDLSKCRRGLGVLRNAPRVEPQRGQMKVAKPYVKTYYSKALVSISLDMADNEHEDGGLIVAEGKGHTTVKQDSSSKCGVIARSPE